MLSNIYHTRYSKRCLFSFATRPFIQKRVKHPNAYEARVISEEISRHGYNVDVIFYESDRSIDYSKYDLIVGLGNVFTQSVGKMRTGCKRLYYATGACFITADKNEIERWNQLYYRRGHFNANGRFEKINNRGLATLSLNEADYIIGVGGHWAESTYSQYKVPYLYVGTVPLTKYRFEDFSRNIGEAKSGFLLMVGKGYVHKGADLLIECFARLKQFNLYIAGEYDASFLDLYKNELENDNINYVGYLDVNSQSFFEVCNKCCYVIDASCSEGTCTAVLTGMKTGLVPIISEIEGIEIEYSLPMFEQFTVEHMCDVIMDASSISDNDIVKIMEGIARFTENEYGIEAYKGKVKKAFEIALEDFRQSK